MQPKRIFFLPVIFLLVAIFALGACRAVIDAAVGALSAYQMISVEELNTLMQAEDIYLVNVHIPLEGNIPGTHATIPYNAVEEHLDRLPTDKDRPLYLYCRSESMGHTAAETLVDLGYTRVYNLEGGYIAWQAAGLPFE